MTSYVRANPDEFQNKPEDAPDYKEEIDISHDVEQIASDLEQIKNIQYSTPVHESTRPENTKVLDQMRKWNCHFDGRDLYAFLERIEELQRAYALSDEQIIQGFPELLRGDAQLWYRNFQSEYHTFDELKNGLRDFYLSPGELRHLDRQINDRKQGATERIRPFVTSLQTLMRRRGGYIPDRQLETVFYNMRAEYRLHISRTSIQNITELIQRTEEFEENKRKHASETAPLKNETKQIFQKHRTPIAAAYDRKTYCWRCKKPGHNRYKCNNPPKQFCSYCGTDGKYAKDCLCRKPGNVTGAGVAKSANRPEN